MDNEKNGLLDFMKDVQEEPELRRMAEELLKKMQSAGWSHPVFCAEMLKIARQKGYRVTPEEVAKLRAEKEGYAQSQGVSEGKGRCWPFDYSYYVTHNANKK
ncbi:MAG: hypothetical protein KH828_01720 [Clostridiales bacterium]|nr:hypothetical protein [Clostridiales bacterium]